MALRVLHIIDSLAQGGAEALVKDMIPRMRRRGVDVALAVLAELDSPFERELRSQRVPFLPTAAGGIYSPKHVFALMPHLSDFDLVHSHLFPAQLFTPMAAMLSGSKVPLLLTEHTTQHRRRKKWLHPLEKWMYGRYTRIACVSEASAENLRAWVPALGETITVVPNGIDVQKFQHAAAVSRSSIGINNGNCLLLYIASFQQRKDHGTLLRAVAQISDVDLLLVGDGELHRQFERQAESLGIAQRVHFLGARTDVAELLKLADIYVHVPVFEGFGIAAAEAMAAGKPIIASNVPGLAQVVGDAAVLVSPGDSEALATAIRRLIASPEQRLQLGGAALRRSNQFSIERTVEGYIELYQNILARTET
jgi:glycosyltransferase involved in cell wall biosynthesis